MRVAAMVLGIVAGVLGIFAALIALLVGGVAQAFQADGGSTIAWLGFAAFFVAVLAIVGGALAKAAPVAAGILMILTCLGGFICISAAWLLSGPLLFTGAILAFIGARRPQQAAPVYLANPMGQPYYLPLPQFAGYDRQGRPVWTQAVPPPHWQPYPYNTTGSYDLNGYIEAPRHEPPYQLPPGALPPDERWQ